MEETVKCVDEVLLQFRQVMRKRVAVGVASAISTASCNGAPCTFDTPPANTGPSGTWRDFARQSNEAMGEELWPERHRPPYATTLAPIAISDASQPSYLDLSQDAQGGRSPSALSIERCPDASDSDILLAPASPDVWAQGERTKDSVGTARLAIDDEPVSAEGQGSKHLVVRDGSGTEPWEQPQLRSQGSRHCGGLRPHRTGKKQAGSASVKKSRLAFASNGSKMDVARKASVGSTKSSIQGLDPCCASLHDLEVDMMQQLRCNYLPRTMSCRSSLSQSSYQRRQRTPTKFLSRTSSTLCRASETAMDKKLQETLAQQSCHLQSQQQSHQQSQQQPHHPEALAHEDAAPYQGVEVQDLRQDLESGGMVSEVQELPGQAPDRPPSPSPPTPTSPRAMQRRTTRSVAISVLPCEEIAHMHLSKAADRRNIEIADAVKKLSPRRCKTLNSLTTPNIDDTETVHGSLSRLDAASGSVEYEEFGATHLRGTQEFTKDENMPAWISVVRQVTRIFSDQLFSEGTPTPGVQATWLDRARGRCYVSKSTKMLFCRVCLAVLALALAGIAAVWLHTTVAAFLWSARHRAGLPLHRCGDVVLAFGSFLSAQQVLRIQRAEMMGEPGTMMADYSEVQNFRHTWLAKSKRQGIRGTALLLCIILVRVAFVLVGSRMDQDGDSNPYTSFAFSVSAVAGHIADAVASCAFISVVLCLMHVTNAHILMIDQYCLRFSSDHDVELNQKEWNIVQAVLHQSSKAMSPCFVVLHTTGLCALMLNIGEAIYADQAELLPWFSSTLRASLLLGFMSCATISAAEVTGRCTRVPAFLNSFDLPQGSRLVEYVIHSNAGFHIFQARLTTFSALKFIYLIVVVTTTVITKVIADSPV